MKSININMDVVTATSAKIKSIETSFLSDSEKVVDVTLSDQVRVSIHVNNEVVDKLKEGTEIKYNLLFFWLGTGNDCTRFAIVGYFETNK